MDISDDGQRPQLRQELTSFQILCIVLSGLIGTGVFITDADALQLAGPGGLLLALLLVSVIVIGVSTTVSHLVQLFPVPNAAFEYTSAFVDNELAWVIGFAYWYAWSSVFATEMLEAAIIIGYWKASATLSSIISYIVIPLLLVFINTRHVKIFGWIETFGGILKVLLMIAMTIVIYHAADLDHDGDGQNERHINVGITYNPKYTDSVGMAICMVMALVSWSFGGIEGSIMAAFEARPLPVPDENHAENRRQRPGLRRLSEITRRSSANPNFMLSRETQDMERLKDVAWASNSVHWITPVLYLFYSLAIALTVPWDYLPVLSIYTSKTANIDFGDSACGQTSMAIFVPLCTNNATYDMQLGENSPRSYQPRLADFVNACLLYSIVSCGNTSLYMASRTLYGLATNSRLERQGNWVVGSIARRIGSVDRSGVPKYAVVLSYLVFCWVPFLGFKDNEQWEFMADVKQFLFVTSSAAYTMVWAALSLAFLRFWYWTRNCAEGLDEDHQRFCHTRFRQKYRKHVDYFVPQPLAAIIGLAGCLFLIIASSSVWWPGQNRANVSKSWSVGVYFLEAVLLAFWILLKLLSGKKRFFVPLDSNPAKLQEVLDDLTLAAVGGIRGRHHHIETRSLANMSHANGHASRWPHTEVYASHDPAETRS